MNNTILEILCIGMTCFAMGGGKTFYFCQYVEYILVYIVVDILPFGQCCSPRMSTCVRGSKLQPIVSTTKKQLCKKKRTVKHTLMQKNKKNTMMQKKGNEKHTIIKKKTMIMQTIK